MKLLTINTRWFFVPVVGMSLMFAASSEETATFIPSLEQTREIGVRSGVWRGRYFLDGSARLGPESADINEIAAAPKGSVALENVYGLIIPHLKRERPLEGEAMSVALYAVGQTSARSLYLDNKETMRTLMYGLRDKTVPVNKIRFEKMLAEYPIVPGDEFSMLAPIYAHDDITSFPCFSTNRVDGNRFISDEKSTCINRLSETGADNLDSEWQLMFDSENFDKPQGEQTAKLAFFPWSYIIAGSVVSLFVVVISWRAIVRRRNNKES